MRKADYRPAVHISPIFKPGARGSNLKLYIAIL